MIRNKIGSGQAMIRNKVGFWASHDQEQSRFLGKP